MCGIAGALDLTGQRAFPPARLLAMTRAIAHRGPDDEHAHHEPGLALGARRLAIVDLDGGRQPIANEDRSIWVAFNGELFDYPEIRRDLLARGHALATRCDTEAWVHLYEDRGEAVFEAARGQFAVSLWDRETRTLLLGRDRVGICPLYYAERDGWLLWGSEVKALLASGLVEPRADPRGIDHLFNFFCAGTSRTFFEGVTSIPPGHYLRVRDGRVELKRYWDLDFPDAGSERREADPSALADELEALLRQSVERRLRGDVPVVSYISGGLDSTVVLGLSSRERGEAVPSFTVGLDRAGPDERSAAAEAAALLGSKLTVVTMDRPKLAGTFPELVTAAEGPVLDTSCAALMKLAGAVHAQGYKVVLTGEGADEALAGYVWYKSQMVRERIRDRIGPALPRLARRALMAAIGGGSARRPPERAIGGVRPAQQDMYEMIAQARGLIYSNAMWASLAGHDPYTDLGIGGDRIWPLAPAEPVALRRLQGDARRAPDDFQGGPDRHALVGRDPLPVPRRRSDRLLRVDRARVQAARADREMAAPPGGRRAHAPPPPGEPPEDDVPRQPFADLPRPGSARLGGPGPQPRVVAGDRLFRREGRRPVPSPANAVAPRDAATVRLRRRADVRRVDPALASPLPRGRPLRTARLDPAQDS